MDISYLLYLQNLRDATSHIFDKFFTYVTNYGEMNYLLPLFAIIYWCINKKTGEFMFISLGFSRLINGLIKIAACIYRPWIRDIRVTPINNGMKTATGYSFPSGHTTNATATFGSFSVLQDKKDKFLKILLWGFAILVGFSRNYIGVHTPQDVIVGFVLTVLTIFGTIKLFDILEKNEKADVWIAFAGILISLLITIYAVNKTYPVNYKNQDNTITETIYLKTSEVNKEIAQNAIVNPKEMALDLYKNIGYIFGIFLGWIIERRFIKFSTDGTTNQKLLRFLVCFSLMQVMLNVICPLLKANLEKIYNEPIIAFLKTFYVICIAPAIIKIIKRIENNQSSDLQIINN
ncbi:MAG: phosphatase PAP2 family protein [Candidatus Riflebacteria bacterium]|nr:phosphatase PAP2 family protein [Candidatus Riflebacteria bacterium]